MSLRRRKFLKSVDEENVFRCPCGLEMVIREEVYQDSSGNVVRYNLALIHFPLYAKDNGRVLGYDNAHGVHERHHMGQVSETTFVSYEATLARFRHEVRSIRRRHEEEDYRRRGKL